MYSHSGYIYEIILQYALVSIQFESRVWPAKHHHGVVRVHCDEACRCRVARGRRETTHPRALCGWRRAVEDALVRAAEWGEIVEAHELHALRGRRAERVWRG